MKFFVDASYINQEKLGSWAVISDQFQRSGVICGNLNSGYCELYATFQGILEASRYDNAVIYTDSNYVYSNLNWKAQQYERKDWTSKSWRKRIPNKNLLRKTFELYRQNPQIKVKEINRKQNKEADKLAKRTLKKVKGENRNGGIAKSEI